MYHLACSHNIRATVHVKIEVGPHKKDYRYRITQENREGFPI